MSDPGEACLSRLRCPTCGAPRRGDAVCHRCRTDLEPLIRLEQRVDRLHAQARRCYAKGWYRRAAALAREAVSLDGSSDSLTLAGVSHLMAGDFVAALETYHRAQRIRRRVRD